MVMEFFRKGDVGLDQIDRGVVLMLADARHSFDLATGALLSGADADAVGADIRATDQRINTAEQDLRSELLVHVAVKGTRDIGSVLGHTLLIKKIERIGDQAKNILDLAEEGVSFVDAPDIDELRELSQRISGQFADVLALLSANDGDETAAREFRDRALDMRSDCEVKVREFLHSTEPGVYAVPRAIYYRYLKRIAANLAGVMTSVTEPFHHQDYYDDGTTDISDD